MHCKTHWLVLLVRSQSSDDPRDESWQPDAHDESSSDDSDVDNLEIEPDELQALIRDSEVGAIAGIAVGTNCWSLPLDSKHSKEPMRRRLSDCPQEFSPQRGDTLRILTRTLLDRRSCSTGLQMLWTSISCAGRPCSRMDTDIRLLDCCCSPI